MSSNIEDHQWSKTLYARLHLETAITLFERAFTVATKPEVSMITSALIPSSHSYHCSHIHPNISLLKLQATLRDWRREYKRHCEGWLCPRTDRPILRCFPPGSLLAVPVAQVGAAACTLVPQRIWSQHSYFTITSC